MGHGKATNGGSASNHLTICETSAGRVTVTVTPASLWMWTDATPAGVRATEAAPLIPSAARTTASSRVSALISATIRRRAANRHYLNLPDVPTVQPGP